MKKEVLFYVSLVICVLSSFKLLSYIADYQKLSDYGKGYIWGNLILLFLGIFGIYFSKKK